MSVMDGNYTYPLYEFNTPIVFRLFYYGVSVPFAYIGNLFTYIIVCQMLKYRHSVPDVLVGALALNDFLTAFIVFTPSIIADIRQKWFPNVTFCKFHSVVTDWYIYTTFGIIVIISLERWTAISKPFIYRRHVTSFKMKFAVAVSGLFCLLSSSIPLINHKVILKPGWYCSLVDYDIGHNGTLHGRLPTANIGIKCAYLLLGIFVVSACNISIIYQLKQKQSSDQTCRQMDRKFAKLMGIICLFFLITWIPNLVSNVTCLYGLEGCEEAEFWARRIVNIGVSINPFVYGVMKRTYRRGYLYLLHVLLYIITFTLIKKPTDSKEIFDLRDRRQPFGNGGKIADVNSGSSVSSNSEKNPTLVCQKKISSDEK